MKLSQIAAVLVVCSAMSSQGALRISEILFNEVGSDVTGEWMEIYNSGLTPIDLSNYKIGDEETKLGTGTTENMVQFPLGATIGAGEVQIIAITATRFNTVYGFLPTYEVTASDSGVPDMLQYTVWDTDGTAINMSNSNDQLVLLNALDEIVDAASWGSSTMFFNPALGSAPDGTSYERINALVDTDTAADWQLGNPSSPGVVVIPEPGCIGLALIGLAGLLYRRRS